MMTSQIGFPQESMPSNETKHGRKVFVPPNKISKKYHRNHFEDAIVSDRKG
jgi:hypothetical protein